jgi:hypothetical protein
MSLRSATSRRFTLMQDTLQRATDNSRALPLRCLTDGVDPCRFWSFFDRTFAALMRTFVLFACSIFLSSCSTPQVAMPSAVILSEDLHFEWVPPNLGHKMEIFISAGRYIRSAEDWDTVYYESNNGLASRVYAGQPAKKGKGGIGYFKSKRRYFVWKFAPSIDAQTPWLLIANMTEEGPLVRLYMAKVPEENEHSLRFEK